MLTLGIVATIADCSDSIDQFIHYHSTIGFKKFYLFIDDNCQAVLEKTKKYPHVITFLREEALFNEWKKLSAFEIKEKKEIVEAEVMVRQELNFFVAHKIAKESGIDWLVHIDIDELFYPNGNNLQEHFKLLQINDYKSITYLNYESISTKIESSSMYSSSEAFKINFFKHKHWFFNSEQKKFIDGASWLPKKYFNFYQNGKSAISTYGQRLKFFDVHSIMGDGPRKLGNNKDPIILHFPCARFIDFKKKYNRLGEFSDMWMGHKRAGEFIDELHLRSRDFYLKNSESDTDLMEFYKENFLINERNIAELIKNKLAIKIYFHTETLSNNGDNLFQDIT